MALCRNSPGEIINTTVHTLQAKKMLVTKFVKIGIQLDDCIGCVSLIDESFNYIDLLFEDSLLWIFQQSYALCF